MWWNTNSAQAQNWKDPTIPSNKWEISCELGTPRSRRLPQRLWKWDGRSMKQISLSISCISDSHSKWEIHLKIRYVVNRKWFKCVISADAGSRSGFSSLISYRSMIRRCTIPQRPPASWLCHPPLDAYPQRQHRVGELMNESGNWHRIGGSSSSLS